PASLNGYYVNVRFDPAEIALSLCLRRSSAVECRDGLFHIQLNFSGAAQKLSQKTALPIDEPIQLKALFRRQSYSENSSIYLEIEAVLRDWPVFSAFYDTNVLVERLGKLQFARDL